MVLRSKQELLYWHFKARPYQNISGWVTTGWLCHSLFLIQSDVINVRNLATLNSTAGKMRFAINVGKKITLTPRNAKMNQNVVIAKEIIHRMIGHVQNGKKGKKYRE